MHIATLVAIDPGLMTGYGILHLYNNKQQGKHTDIRLGDHSVTVQTHGTTDMDNAPETLELLMQHAQFHTPDDVPICLVVEDFIITRTAMQKNTTWSSEVTGMAKYAAKRLIPNHQLVIDESQSSSDMKNAIHKPKVLQDMGVKVRGDKMVSHESDALGHGILYAARVNLKQVKLPKLPTLD